MARSAPMSHQETNDPNSDNLTLEAVARTFDDDQSNWPAAEGYSPLVQDMDSMNNGMLFSDGTTAFFSSHPGDFLAAAVGSTGWDSEDSWSDSDEDADHRNFIHETMVDDQISSTKLDYNTIADRLLMSLEEDYQMTLQGKVRKTTLEQVATRAGFGAVQAQSNNTEGACSAAHFQDFVDVEGGDKGVESETWKIVDDSVTINSKVTEPSFEIDAQAVSRAVQSIQLRDPNLLVNLEKWESERKHKAELHIPRQHPIIPSATLSAFRKKTSKAREATDKFTCSATLAEALARLRVIQGQETIRIVVLGFDLTECLSEQRIRSVFGPLVRWIGTDMVAPPRHFHLHFVASNTHSTRHMKDFDLMPSKSARSGRSLRFESSSATCYSGDYENLARIYNDAHLIIAYSGGASGYDILRSVIRYLGMQVTTRLEQQQQDGEPQTDHSGALFVVTANSLQESQDAYEAMQQEIQIVVSSKSTNHPMFQLVWEPQLNPYASKMDHERGQVCHENVAWQAWRV